jgi:hypothetical protein
MIHGFRWCLNNRSNSWDWAYSALQEAGVNFIPQLLGIFNVPGTNGAMLFTMVGKISKN